MSVFWLFVLVFANAWALGLWLLPRLHRQSTAIVNLFTGALVGAVNFAVGGAVHVRMMADGAMMSMGVAFGLRFVLHTSLMFGFYERPHGRTGTKQDSEMKQWGSAALGGLYLSVVALVIEIYVRAQPGWEADELYFTVQNLKDAFL